MLCHNSTYMNIRTVGLKPLRSLTLEHELFLFVRQTALHSFCSLMSRVEATKGLYPLFFHRFGLTAFWFWSWMAIILVFGLLLEILRFVKQHVFSAYDFFFFFNNLLFIDGIYYWGFFLRTAIKLWRVIYTLLQMYLLTIMYIFVSIFAYLKDEYIGFECFPLGLNDLRCFIENKYNRCLHVL